jgi:hypothetical protein
MNMAAATGFRTSSLFRVKANIISTFDNSQADGDCQTARRYGEGGLLTGDFTGQE